MEKQGSHRRRHKSREREAEEDDEKEKARGNSRIRTLQKCSLLRYHNWIQRKTMVQKEGGSKLHNLHTRRNYIQVKA